MTEKELKKLKEEFEELKKNAEQGDADAQYNLGNAYLNGNGVEKDLEEAAKWFKKAADRGHKEARLLSWAMYYHGAFNKITKKTKEKIDE